MKPVISQFLRERYITSSAYLYKIFKKLLQNKLLHRKLYHNS